MIDISDSGLYTPDGKKIRTISFPTVKFRDHLFAIQLMDPKTDVAKEESGGYRPGDIVKEYRARFTELEDRLQILSALICVIASDGIEAGKEFLDSIGMTVTDLNGKVLYPPGTSN